MFKATNKEFIDTIPKIAKHFNIKYSSLMKNINKDNLSLEETIDYLINNSNNTYIYFKYTDHEFIGKLFEICKHFNVIQNYVSSYKKIKFIF